MSVAVKDDEYMPNGAEVLLSESVAITQHAVESVRRSSQAKGQLVEELQNMAIGFDEYSSKLRKKLSSLDELVYEGRIENAKNRSALNNFKSALPDDEQLQNHQAHHMNILEKKLCVLKDSLFGLHREYYYYSNNYDVDDLRHQVTDLAYRAKAQEQSNYNRGEELSNRLSSALDVLYSFKVDAENAELIRSIVGGMEKVIGKIKKGSLSLGVKINQEEPSGELPETPSSFSEPISRVISVASYY